MKVLTIKQPWATLIMQGYKRFEFRSWQTKYRGDLLIHAGKVTLVDCVKMSPEFKEMLLRENEDIYTDSSFKENYGWQLESVEVFDEPIEAKGKLSLWEYDL